MLNQIFQRLYHDLNDGDLNGDLSDGSNPEVATGLTSGGYEDKVDVITPINILFRGGGKFLCGDDHDVMMS